MGDPAIAPATSTGCAATSSTSRSTREGLPLAAARNAGVRAALAAGADVVVLLDVDCLAGARPGRRPTPTPSPATADVVWSGPVTYLAPPPAGGYDLDELAAPRRPPPRPAGPAAGRGRATGAAPELFWSLSFALSAAGLGAQRRLPRGLRRLRRRGHRLRRAWCSPPGSSLGWVGAARAYHQHHPVESPPVRHLDDVLRNGALFHRRWGSWPMTGWLEAFADLGLVEHRDDAWVRT